MNIFARFSKPKMGSSWKLKDSDTFGLPFNTVAKVVSVDGKWVNYTLNSSTYHFKNKDYIYVCNIRGFKRMYVPI